MEIPGCFSSKIAVRIRSCFMNSTGDTPCIIDFYADWCGPCKMIAPIMEEFSDEYAGEVDIYKIDTEAEQELAAVLGIRSIPSILFVPTDDQPQMAMGALPKHTFKEVIRDKIWGCGTSKLIDLSLDTQARYVRGYLMDSTIACTSSGGSG